MQEALTLPPGPWTLDSTASPTHMELGSEGSRGLTRKSGPAPQAPLPSTAHRDGLAGPGGRVIEGGMEQKIQGPKVHRVSLSGGQSR